MRRPVNEVMTEQDTHLDAAESGSGRHILLVHQLFVAGDQAGGTRHFELARELGGEGDRVTVVTSPVSYLSGKPKPIATDLPAGLRIRRASLLLGGSGGFVARVISFLSFMVSSFWTGLRVRDVDLVWGTTPPIFQAPTAWLLARMKGVPFVLEVRDLWPDFAVELGVLKSPVLIRMAKGLERFLYEKADLILVNSPGFEEHVRREGGKNVVLVANGVDPTQFAPEDDGAAVRAERGWGERFVSLYAGAHGIPNDLDVVLDAAAAAEDDDGLFAFVGAGREVERLRQRADELGLRNVEFVGARPKSEMAGFLAAADVCIAILQPLPLFRTTYPNKVFDYMAAGRPVVLAIDGVIRRVVDEANGGTFVLPGDADALLAAIRAYRLDPDLRREHGQAGRSAVLGSFTRAKQAQALRQSFLELLARKP